MSNVSLDARDAYQGIEDSALFGDPEKLAIYREHCLAKTAPETRFLAEFLPPQASVLEVGCGNGRLLLDLAAKGHLASGIGIDVARTRIDFARAWHEAMGVATPLNFLAEDVLALGDRSFGAFDAVVCITSAFGYFDALVDQGGRKVMAWMARHLKPGGTLLLELYQYPREIAECRAQDGSIRIWNELPAEDAFRFYLHERWFDEAASTLSHRKIFIHRSGSIDEGRGDRQRIYTPQEVSDLCQEAGLTVEGCYADWDRTPFVPGDEALIVQVRRPL